MGSGFGSCVEIWKLVCDIEIEEHTKKKSDKNNFKKRVKDCSYRERLEKLGSTTLLKRRMRGNLSETFKIREFLIMVNIFQCFSSKENLLSRQTSKTKSTNQLDFFAHGGITFLKQTVWSDQKLQWCKKKKKKLKKDFRKKW